MRRPLFERGFFTLHSGGRTVWRINCESLGEEDLFTIAEMIECIVPKFGAVEGVPSGGLRLAEKMKFYTSEGPLLIVDDVLTTGTSMINQREDRKGVSYYEDICRKYQ